MQLQNKAFSYVLMWLDLVQNICTKEKNVVGEKIHWEKIHWEKSAWEKCHIEKIIREKM